MWFHMLINLVLKDTMEAVSENRQFYYTIESVYNFFGHSIVRWQKFQNVHDRYCSNPTLKALNPIRCSGRYDAVYALKERFALNPIRWSGRYDAVYALKERFCDVVKCLTNIILTSTKLKEHEVCQDSF